VKYKRNISLPFGEYKIFLNVQDSDSRINIKKNKKILIEKSGYLSTSLLFIKNIEGELIHINSLSDKQDTVWMRSQINFIDSLKYFDESGNPLIKINYSVKQNESIKDSGEVIISESSVHNLYYIPIPLRNYKDGNYELEISYLGKKEIASLKYRYKTKYYWTDDIDEVIGVMRYILSNSDYKELKAKDEKSRWDYINSYWKKLDPSPDSDYNEILSELNQRVKFSNKNFSILMDGWKSDRGRIYIIHGEPLIIDEGYQGPMGYAYLKWSYGNGKEFLFVDKTMSGNYIEIPF
jgi:GWxTD domain-containing protein